MKKIKIIGIVYFLMVFITIIGAYALNTDVSFISSIEVERGILTGNISDTKVYNTDYLSIQEVTGENGLKFYVNITSVKGNLSDLNINYRYKGGVSHSVTLHIYDYEFEEWFLLDTFTNNANFLYNSYDITFLSNPNQEVLLLFNHLDSGVDTHQFDIDYLIITSIYEETLQESKSFLELDLENTFIIILIIIFLLTGLLLSLLIDTLSGGAIILLIGILIAINNVVLLGSIIFILGFLLITLEEPLIKKQ